MLGKNSNKRITDSKFWKSMIIVAGAIDMVAMALQYGQGKLLSNGRDDELESDELDVFLMIKTDYYPEEIIGVMQILKNASSPNKQPKFQSTYPDSENRIEK